MRKLARFLKNYRLQVILGPIFKLTEAVFELIVPIVTADIIDNGVRTGDVGYVWRMGGVMLPRAVFQAELERALASQTQTGAAQSCATPEMAGSGLPFPWLPWGVVYSYSPDGFWAARS